MNALQRIGIGAAALLLTLGLLVPESSQAQSTSPASIELGSDSEVCAEVYVKETVSITVDATTTSTISITLGPNRPDGLLFYSDLVEGVGVDGTAEFEVIFEGDGSEIKSTIDGRFYLEFRDANDDIIAKIEVELTCGKTGKCDVPTLNQDDIDQDNRTLSNTMQDDEGVAEFTFTTLDNFTVVDNFDSGYDASDSDGDTKLDTWTWDDAAGDPPTSVDFTLEGGPDNTSTYFLDVTDDCEPSNTATFDPAYEFGPAASRTQLAGNAPNPFSGQTTVEFDLAEQSRVTVAVYDMMGRKVATLVDGVRSAGPHAVGWNGQSDSGQDLASGVYLLRMQAEGKSETKRMTIIR